ncbi:hypothetical protein SGRIM119S_04308 [Streptomyces griseorubiginosus]
MKRAIPVVVLSIAGLVPVWLYQPSAGSSTVQATTPAPSSTSSGSAGSSGGNVVTSSTITTEKGPVQLQVTFDGTEDHRRQDAPAAGPPADRGRGAEADCGDP